MTATDAFERAYASTTCRDRQRQLLSYVEDRGALSHQQLLQVVDATVCPAGHDLHFAGLMTGLLSTDQQGMIRLSRQGDEWLVENGRPSPDWRESVEPGAPPLRSWQEEALRSWSAHGRHGVIEAVTGTGKSRVGVEATREALADDYNVVIVVPTVDLVDQWVRTLRQNKVPGVGGLGDGKKATFGTHRVVVGTVQSLYLNPPIRPDGKVLVVADECHRYGAGQWRRVLHPTYRRRLGLTATFERNDDGIKDLLSYFGGGPVFMIGFKRAIADGVVAHYGVKLLGVPLTRAERGEYNEADETLRDARIQLLSAGFPAEPFGAFLYEVQKAAEDDEDPTITDVARRYLKAFSKRIDVMTNAHEKINVTRSLAPQVNRSRGSIVFTRRVDMAEEIAATLVDAGVRAQPIHSDLTRTQRHDRLSALKGGRLKALVAPTVLDEGIDVPDIDLAIVMGGSRSRRQMIQRMGRVLRLKADGRDATFVVVYAENTAEDLTQTDGVEGCLDLIIESADTVERLELKDGEVIPSEVAARVAPRAEAHQAVSQEQRPTSLPEEDDATTATEIAVLPNLDSQSLPMTQRALRDFVRAHGVGEEEAAASLRRMLADFQQVAKVASWPHAPGAIALRHKNLELVVARDRFVAYRSRRRDASTWDDLKQAAPLDESAIPAAATTPSPEDRPAENLKSDRGANATSKAVVAVGPERACMPREVDNPGEALGPSESAGATPRNRKVTSKRARKRNEAVPFLQTDPSALLDLLDAETIVIDMRAVASAARAIGGDDVFTEAALQQTRLLLAQDLRSRPEVEFTSEQFLLHGSAATWTLRSDGQVVLDLELVEEADQGAVASEGEDEQPHGSSPPGLPRDALSTPPPGLATTQPDMVAQIERLAVLWRGGLLTDEEFTAAKARLLF